MEFRHFHFNLQGCRALDGMHQHQLPRLPFRPLDGKMVLPDAAHDAEAHGVPRESAACHPEQSSRGSQVRGQGEVMEGNGVGGICTRLAVHQTWVSLTFKL